MIDSNGTTGLIGWGVGYVQSLTGNLYGGAEVAGTAMGFPPEILFFVALIVMAMIFKNKITTWAVIGCIMVVMWLIAKGVLF